MSDDIHDDTIEIARETMTGDLRDFILDRVKGWSKPWSQMTEDEQRFVITQASDAAKHAVKQAVRIIAADGRPVIMATLDKVTVKDGIDAALKLSRHDPLRHNLMDATGKAVLIVVADSEDYTGEQNPAEPDADQPDLPIEDDGPVFDHTAAAAE